MQTFITKQDVFGELPPLTYKQIPPFTWIMTLDKFMHKYDGKLYNEDDLTHFTKLSEEVEDSRLRYSFYDYIKMFPEAKNIAKKHLKAEIKQLKEELIWTSNWRNIDCQRTINNMPFRDQALYIWWFDVSFNERVTDIERQIKKATFKISMIEERNINRTGINEQDIEMAKDIEIINFLPERVRNHSRIATVNCPFHEDHTPSFTIYLKQNTYFCYSCKSGGTVIDFIMALKGVSFLPAVKFLLNK